MTRFWLCALPLLAGCHFDAKHSADEDGNVTINASADGKVAFDLPFAKGELKLPGDMMSHGDIDIDGVKLMPGSKVTGFSVLASEGKESTATIAFSAPKPPSAVRDYFTAEFARQGADTKASGEGLTVKSKDGDDISIGLASEGAGTKGTIAVRSND